MEELLGFLKPLLEIGLEALSGKYGQVAQICASIAMVIGVLRACLKPLSELCRAYVNVTPSMSDNEKLDKIMSSKGYKGLVFFLDWFASIKLPKKK